MRIIDDFARAAVRVVRAGFEVIELHGAHGYLGSQFLSPRSNRRTDRWGGSIGNRTRFLAEAVSAVRDAVSEELARRASLDDGRPAAAAGVPGSFGVAVSVRLGVAESEGGLTLQEGIRAAQLLEECGADAVHVSHGGSIPADLVAQGAPRSPLLEMARRVKRAVSVPVIGVGGVRSPKEANELVASGVVDLVAVGRAQLADPGWAVKSLSGRCWHFTDMTKCPARHRLQRIA
jgi:2,4-dienoyl-CoA reductase-like NADH-dependent reductase (Old Yellow Enzyme family)